MPRDTVALRLMDTVKVVVWMNIWNRNATSQPDVHHMLGKYQVIIPTNAAFTSFISNSSTVGNVSTLMNV